MWSASKSGYVCDTNKKTGLPYDLGKTLVNIHERKMGLEKYDLILMVSIQVYLYFFIETLKQRM